MIEINRYKLCPGVEVSAHWGEITGDIADQSDLIAYINEHGGSDAVWGSITGDIADQSDLTGYVSTALSGYATESWVGEKGYITSSALSGYATEDWVTAQSYLTSSSLKTVNNQSLVGEGDITVSGGLTPEQEEAIEPLEEASDGVLVASVVPAKHADYYNTFNSAYEIQNYLYDLEGEIYTYISAKLYKFDTDSLTFKFIRTYATDNNQPLWMDWSGRLYQGVTYQMEDDGTCTQVDLQATGYWCSQGNSNLVYGMQGIYILYGTDYADKFNEDDQVFEQIPITVDQNLYNIYDFGVYAKYYEGHLIYVYYGHMYELIEDENSLEIVEVQEPYFDLTAGGIQIYFNSDWIFENVNGEYYLLHYYDHYKLDDGQWVEINIKDKYNNNVYYYGNGKAAFDFILGYSGAYEPNSILVTNPGDEDVTCVGWSPVGSMAVDLSSDQQIHGNKNFNMIEVNQLYVRDTVSSGRHIGVNFGNTNFNALNLNVTATGVGMFNGNPIATTDKCIVNRTYGLVGQYFAAGSSLINDYAYNWFWKTASGRLFRKTNNEYYEFDGSSWTQVTLSVNINDARFVVSTLTDTFFYDYQNGGDTYIWDDTTSDWVYICRSSYSSNDAYNGVWPCGSTLRFQGYLKLVNNGGTWSWVADAMNYTPGKYVICNGTVYVFNQNHRVQSYDEATETYTDLIPYLNNWGYNVFVAGGNMYYTYENAVYLADISEVGNPDYNPAVSGDTGMYYVSWDRYYCEYSGKIWTTDNQNYWGYCYSMTETLPEVPATNGTYVLQATRAGDTVTYEWVSNVI